MTIFAIAALSSGLAIAVALMLWRGAEPLPVPRPGVAMRSTPLLRGEPAERPGAEVPVTDADAPALAHAPTEDGCGAPPPFVGFGDLKADSFGPGIAAHIPVNYDPEERYPVLLMFHRKFGKGKSLLIASKMGESADERGFVALSFSSANPTDWDVGDQLRIVADTLVAADEQLCLDKTRIYAYGDETGSSFVRELACRTPLSAVAVTSVTTGSGCLTADPPPRLRIYGKHDLAIPPQGGPSCSMFGGNYISRAEIDQKWTSAHQCDGVQKPWGDFPGGTCHTWSCARSPYVVCATDSGAVWPHRSAIFEEDKCRSPKPDVLFPYRDAIWRFFETHGRRLEVAAP